MSEILIFSSGVARDLMQKGFKAIDIRPNKSMRDRTIFVFENTQDIKKYLEITHSIVLA